MKLKIDLDDLAYFIFSDLSDKQRLECIKKLIYTAPNAQVFQDMVLKAIQKIEID